MSKFEIGDAVQLPDIPIVVEVLEFGTCEEGDGCAFGPELHSSEFERVS